MSGEFGFVVIEFNQASGWPSVVGPLTDTREESELLLKGYEDESREYGRRDRYVIGRVVEVEPFGDVPPVVSPGEQP